MQILIVGIGSIGTRHIENLVKLGYNNLVIVSKSGNVKDDFKKYPIFQNIEDALNSHHISHAFICTPTAYHIHDLALLCQNSVEHIYLEKPVSHNWDNIDKILYLSTKCKRLVVGYDLHFDPGLEKVKSLLDNNNIGELLSFNAQVGQYLPDWRPYEDHKKGMSASVKKGGGVMLDLIHEFDYMRWLIGEPKYIACLSQHNSVLGIETEDVADVLIEFNNQVNGTIHLDYHQKKLVRNCLITGDKGSIKWDLTNSIVSWNDINKSEYEFSYKGFERNDRYLAILKAFMDTSYFDERLTNLDDALVSLKMVVAAKRSAQQRIFIKFNDFKAA